VGKRFLFCFEVAALVSLVLLTRCANYRDVFANGQIYFVDADCYARMTRARICYEHPGAIIWHHDFENFPAGTSPHTTAPLDYLIVALAALVTPFSRNALDLAGATVSPLIAVGLGIFLCWWTQRMSMRFRFALLILYAVSPILAHGTALGRPDHQSLLIALIGIALCADWMLLSEGRALRDRAASPSSALQHLIRRWSILSGASWAMAIWGSLYEPIVLLAITTATCAVEAFVATRVAPRDVIAARPVRWFAFFAIFLIGALVERRMPASFDWGSFASFAHWSGTIGELWRAPLLSSIWFQWCSWLIVLSPVLIWRWRIDRRDLPWFMIVLLGSTFALTLWEMRWGYFFALIFTLVVPEVLRAISKLAHAEPRASALGYVVFAVALFPVAQAWDKSLSDEAAAVRAENGTEQMELRALASEIDGPFLAPWWFSPALAYWSRQPAVAGSSHESLSGIVDCASFYAATDPKSAAGICRRRQAKWLLIYDSDRLAENSARILAHPVAPGALCYVLDRHSSAAPSFLKLVRQTARFKLYRVEGL
jgi:hypothetical protein